MIRVVTDSTAYLSEKTVKSLGITVVPLIVNYGNESFKEGETYSFSEFYHLLKTKGGFPSTSQPSAGDFIEAYKSCSASGEEIISIHLSSGISGTIASAQTAAGMLDDRKVTIFDTMSTAAIQGFMVEEAATMAKDGASMEEIIRRLTFMRDNNHCLFMVGTLEYLQRGGRIGGAQALLGTLLQIKPILMIRGKVDTFEKVRTKQKAIARIIDEFSAFYQNHSGKNRIMVSVLHVDSEQEAEELAKKLAEAHPDCHFTTSYIGPVIGSHVGPGTLGLAFCAAP